tara:strand:- start:2582 stop:3031 length:450 start_codon:yes stop_codon:yes gene_type:complete
METKTIINSTNNALNIGQIKSMLDEIDMMTHEEHHNIINILKKHKISYMENDNGIFLKLNQLSIEIILEIYQYVEEVRLAKKDLETAIRSVEYKSTIDTTETSENDAENLHSNIEIEDWKKAIIEKMRNDSKNNRTKKRKSTQKSSNNE